LILFGYILSRLRTTLVSATMVYVKTRVYKRSYVRGQSSGVEEDNACLIRQVGTFELGRTLANVLYTNYIV